MKTEVQKDKVPSSPMKTTIAKQVLDKLIGKLASERTPIGTKLPTEKEIAEELNVGRSTVREAIKTLNILGLVRSKAGSGSYLEHTNVYAKLTLFAALLSNQDRLEMLDLRASIESYALLKFHRDLHRDHSSFSPEYVRHIEETLEMLTKLVSSMFSMAYKSTPHRLVQADYQFHESILNYSQNELIIGLFDNLEQFMREEIKDSHNLIPVIEIARNHQDLLEAIKNPDIANLVRSFEFHMNDTKSKIVRTF